jgi:hypothetical protein
VIHQFSSPGRYVASVRRGEHETASLTFDVSDGSETMQLDFDLAATARRASRQDCECDATTAAADESGASKVPHVSSKGYVLFYVSAGDGGFSVSARLDNAREPSFDSTRLGEGDLYAVSLFAPTRYQMKNQAGKATGQVSVSLDQSALRKLAVLDAVYVKTSPDAFDPHELHVVSGQGIVFRVEGAARIVIEQVEPPRDNDVPSKRRFVRQKEAGPRPKVHKK